jgi:hypothetical protein
VGSVFGKDVGLPVGFILGRNVGNGVGLLVVGMNVVKIARNVGSIVGVRVGEADGTPVGARVGNGLDASVVRQRPQVPYNMISWILYDSREDAKARFS